MKLSGTIENCLSNGFRKFSLILNLVIFYMHMKLIPYIWIIDGIACGITGEAAVCRPSGDSLRHWFCGVSEVEEIGWPNH